MALSMLKKLQKLFLPNMGTVLLMAFMLFAYNAWAAPSVQESLPGVISYQGTLTDSAGQPFSGDIDMTFRLYDTPTNGTELWTEAHTGTNSMPVQDGLFHVLLGSLSPIPPTVWTNDQLYIGIQVGNESEMSPRERLGAVPYAMRANIALTVPDNTITSDKMAVDYWNINVPGAWETTDAVLDWTSVPGMNFAYTPSVNGVILLNLDARFRHTASEAQGYCGIMVNSSGTPNAVSSIVFDLPNVSAPCSTNLAYPVLAGNTYSFSMAVQTTKPGTLTVDREIFTNFSAVFFGTP